MKTRSGLLVGCMAVCVAAAAQAQTAFFAVSQDDFYQAVTNAAVYERPLIDNALRKTGAGTLTLQNPRMTRAQMDVLGGAVEVGLTNAFVPPALPAALRQKAAFWVDANTNVVADGEGKVSRWHDAREASVDGPAYQYMMATNGETARQPAVVADAGLGGKKYLDFGSWGDQNTNVNSRWLFWAGTNGLEKTLDLRAVFIVFGSHNGYNTTGGGITLLQNTSMLTTNGVNGAPFAGAGDRLWLNNDNVIADDGINYLDRVMRGGRNLQIFDKAYHMVEVLTLQAAKANTFAKDRTYPGYSGGSRICEALLFTEELTESEHAQVQDYLWHKWFSRSEASLGSFRLANASVLDLATGSNNVQVTVSGNGAVSKSGSGTLALMNGGTDAFDGTVRLREGSLLVAGEPFLFDLEGGGQTIYAQDVNVNRTAADAGKVVKTGGGELALASVAEEVTKIEVAAGTLRLATPRAADAVPMADGNVNEWSLEAFTNGTTAPYVNFTSAPSAPPFTTNGWTFDRSAYASGGFLVGVAFDYPRSGQVIATGLAPDGHAVLYINRGKVETDFTVAEPGVYRLEFQAAARSGMVNRHVVVSIDGVPVRTISTLTAVFWRHEIVLPHLTAGTHKVSFTGEGADNSIVAFVDAIRVVPVTLCSAAPVLAAVTNPSFEEPVSLYEAAVVITEPAGTGWTFSGLAGIGRIQSINTSPRYMPQTVPEGIGAAVLPVAGSIRQTVAFPTSGVYRLSFAAAARIGLVNHTFNVLLDNKLVRPFKTADTAFRRIELALPQVVAGAQLELSFVGTGAANTASLIDDIRIERIGSDLAVDALKNGGFESVTTIDPLVTTNWACTSLAGVYSNVNAWGETAPYGTYFGYTALNSAFSQTVTFAESGSYALRFITKTRASYPLPQYHDFEVTWNGTRVGRVLNMGGDMRSYELPLPPVAAGVPYALRFRGLDSYYEGGGSHTLSMYDEIAIVPVQAARPRRSLAGRFPETTELDLAAGAKLALDFGGEIKVRTVRYAGQTVSGMIDASTHPEFVSGTGSILSPAKGTIITLK